MKRATRVRITPPSGDERLTPMITQIQKLMRVNEPRVAYPVRMFGARGDGRDDTIAVQKALDEAAQHPHAEVRLDGMRCVVKTLRFDARNIRVVGPGALIAHDDIPDDGAIILSMAGGSDTAVNGALLDTIYGPGVQPVRTLVAGSMEWVVFRDIEFVGNANNVRGFHMTGFTRGCGIWGCRFTDIKGADICLNGSWSFSLLANLLKGNGTDGFGLALGMIGNGERSGAVICNAITMLGNECTEHNIACEWDFGSGGTVAGNIFEQCVAQGFRTQSVAGVNFTGNYLETCANANAQFGGTNGTDFIEGWLIAGNYFNNASGGGHNIKLQSAERCTFGYQMMSGTRTQWYQLTDGDLVRDCVITIPDLTTTYATNVATDMWTGFNDVRSLDGRPFRSQQNANYTTTHLDFARELVKTAGGGGETITIDSQANKPCRRGSKIRVRNLGGGTLTVAVTSDVLALAGAAAGNRTIADMGVFEAELMLAVADGDATNTWVASGQGVT